MSVYCRSCGTENEEKFSYCKNCGTPLRATEENSANKRRSYDPYSEAMPTEIDGIATDDYCNFVGSNQNKIVKKFAKMSHTGTKVSWCLPALLLCVFFGFFGAAIWLFYRKMFRYGGIALAVGLLILGINTAVTYQPLLIFGEQFRQVVIEVMSNGFNESSFENAINQLINQLSSSRQIAIANFINETANYLSAFIYGLFGLYLYKKHAFNKLTAYRAANTPSDYYNYGISAIGGTSIGMAVLTVIIFIAASNIFYTIPFITIFF